MNVPLGTERDSSNAKLKLTVRRNRHNARRCCPSGATSTSFTQYASHATPPLSSSMFPLKVISALVALLLIASVRAETNVTIDDTDPRIVYKPSWSFQADVRLSPFYGTCKYSLVRQTDNTQDRFNKTTHFTSKQGATGSLTFSVEYRFLPKAQIWALAAGPLLNVQVAGRTLCVLRWIRNLRSTFTCLHSYHSPTPARQPDNGAI